ncbi:MAG: hypothetical protein AABX90_02790, partial [Nanoarchaeota archaeon]
IDDNNCSRPHLLIPANEDKLTKFLYKYIFSLQTQENMRDYLATWNITFQEISIFIPLRLI